MSSGAPEGVQWDLELFSPCKINLFLRIIRKREDGFHDLASLFQTVGFGDTMRFKKLDGEACEDELTCNMPDVPVDSSNLVIKALDLWRERTGVRQFFRVDLDKRVPAQGGLGGGSGNCATAFFAANELCGAPAALGDLEAWSAELGSDITFFFSRGTCYCTGRGEVLHPQAPLPPSVCYLVKPEEGLSTPLVFKNLDYALLSPADPEEVLATFTGGGDRGLYGATYVNDLEPPAFKVMPALAELKADLRAAGFPVVMMSGSGSTLFALGEPAEEGAAGRLRGAWPGVDVWRSEFVQRPDNDHLWYNQEVEYQPTGQ